jgi:hypothetical protein
MRLMICASSWTIRFDEYGLIGSIEDEEGARIGATTATQIADVIWLWWRRYTEAALNPVVSAREPTRDETIAALNEAPRGGQVAGRRKMQEVCGVNRLQDVRPEDYGKLAAALQAAE